jgi:hypothetical protein
MKRETRKERIGKGKSGSDATGKVASGRESDLSKKNKIPSQDGPNQSGNQIQEKNVLLTVW